MTRALALAVLLFSTSLAFATEPRTFECNDPLPQFTLGEASNPTDAQVKTLCTCIWSQFPEDGWERSTSTKIRAGENPGWRARAFQARFGQALEKCGGFNL